MFTQIQDTHVYEKYVDVPDFLSIYFLLPGMHRW
jgi:hypothetical protein